MSRFINHGTVKIYTESFGNQQNPALLLIIGAGAVSTLYPDDFCQTLADSGLFILRYDQRDYGYSTHFPTVPTEKVNSLTTDELPYTMDDLVDDALTVLSAYNIETAHVMGYSMGGAIAQILAIQYPQKVLSLITQSVGPVTGLVDLPDIPQETWDILLSNQPTGNYEKDLPGWLTSFKYLHGSYPLDEERAITYIKEIYKRETKPEVAWNHIAVQNAMLDYYEDLQKISTPTLVIYGEEDKIQPLPYGKSLADLIPNAKLETIPKAGHMFFNTLLWQKIGQLLIKHLSRKKY